MRKAVGRAQAEYAVAKAAIPQAEAALAAATANRRFREKRYKRQLAMFKSSALQEELVDEAEDRKQAAIAAEKSATAALTTAQSQELAAKAKVDQAGADVDEAEAEVKVAEADVDRLTVRLKFSQVRSPCTGFVTRRNLFPGGFVRAARDGERTPLLAIDRTDKVRVVVQVPDRDVPYADKGDPAKVEIENLGGKTFCGPISRTQGSEDQATRTMRVEIDLDNSKGELRPGMFAKVTINLATVANALTIPAGCLIGAAKEGNASVYVVRDGRAVLTPIRIGTDNGVKVEVLSGLQQSDTVVYRYSGALVNGGPVIVNDSEVGSKQ
jgi:RND family efflux transporter MFP subunit